MKADEFAVLDGKVLVADGLTIVCVDEEKLFLCPLLTWVGFETVEDNGCLGVGGTCLRPVGGGGWGSDGTGVKVEG